MILGLTSDAVKRNLPLLRCRRGLQAGKETALGMIVMLVQLGCAAIEKVLFVSLSSKSVSLLGKFPRTERSRDSEQKNKIEQVERLSANAARIREEKPLRATVSI